MALTVDDGQTPASGSATAGYGRQAFVGLGSARAGTVALGRQYTPMFAMSAGALDPFGANFLGTITTTQALQGGLLARANNAVSYTLGYPTALDAPTPRLGFSLAALAAPGESTSHAGDQFGLAVGYGQDRWFAGYAGQQLRGSAVAVPPSTAPRQTSHVVGGTLRLDGATLFAAAHKNSNDAAGAAGVDRVGWSLGVRVPLKDGQLIGQYQRSDDRTAFNRDVANVSLAGEYSFSRRTVGYVNVGKNFNAATASTPLSLSTVLVTAGYDPVAAAVGMRHSF